jgi:hypothetical protein
MLSVNVQILGANSFSLVPRFSATSGKKLATEPTHLAVLTPKINVTVGKSTQFMRFSRQMGQFREPAGGSVMRDAMSPVVWQEALLDNDLIGILQSNCCVFGLIGRFCQTVSII